MLATARLSYRLQRFEILIFGLLAAAAAAAAVVVAWRLDAVGVPTSCFGYPGSFAGPEPAGAGPLGCEARMADFTSILNGVGSPVLMALGGTPFLLGLFLGSPIVGRELERGTIRLAWSLAPSRRAWFAGRLLPVVAIVLVLAGIAGIASDRLFAARSPAIDMNAAFFDYGLRGVLVPAHAFLGFAVAIFVGSVIGRALPALLVALGLFVALFVGVTWGHEAILRGEAVVQAEYRATDKVLDSGFRLVDGRILNWAAAGEVDYSGDGLTMTVNGVRAEPIQWVIPGSRYPAVALREAAADWVIGAALILATLFVVERRRPT